MICASDLMTRSRLEAAVRALQLPVYAQQIPGREAASDDAGAQQVAAGWPDDVRLVLLSVTGDPAGWEGVLKAAKRLRVPVVGVGPHGEGQRLQQARRLGCEQVVTNSALPSILPELIKERDEADGHRS